MAGSVPPGHVAIRIMAGITTGGMSVIFAQPTDVVKVRMQAQLTGLAPRYIGTINAYRTIAVKEGIKGLWKGMKHFRWCSSFNKLILNEVAYLFLIV